jgi:pimeloyl-ACP methyl ester carboxylesterase
MTRKESSDDDAMWGGVAMTEFGRGNDTGGDWISQVSHEYADSDGVRIHYAKAGEGPLVVFIHGFPDFWYSWHHQMRGLAGHYTVVALDTRGYNESDKPEGVESYDITLLVGDVAAVIRNEGREKAIIVGHDWGGAIAWGFAATLPAMTEKLIIVNLPHIENLVRELRNNPQQQANSQYARNFQQPNSHQSLSADVLANLVARGDSDLEAKYRSAFENSSFDAMMNYYRRNYPREPYAEDALSLPKVQCPVLQFHGLDDWALLPGALNDSWDRVEKDWTLVTLPGTGHWAHHEQAELLTDTMKWWLAIRR